MCAMWKDRFSTGLSAYLIMMALIAPGTTANAQSPPERPFSIKTALTLLPDSDLFEYVCAENEKDRVHLGK